MKKILLSAVVLLAIAALILMAGCSSPTDKAQKLFNAGKYEEVIAQYGSDPNVAAVVTQAKEKLAEKMVADGKYAAVLELYPETAAAKAARDKLAEQLFLAKNYAELIAKYPETSWAAQAKVELDKQAAATIATSGVSAAKDKAAQAELDRILKVRIKDLRMKALKEFVANPAYTGTKAVARAQKELGGK
jgi:hypothetical protein